MKTIDQIRASFPLDSAWGTPERFDYQANINGLAINLVGFSAEGPNQITATAGAACLGADDGAIRAYFELLERTAILQYQRTESDSRFFPESSVPKIWQFSKSNGVALHATWNEACRRAGLELFERDCILRSWYYGASPRILCKNPNIIPSQLMEIFEFKEVDFSPEDSSCRTIGLFGFLKNKERTDFPLCIFGFGAEESHSLARKKALGEMLQRLGFLYGEELPLSPPDFSGPTPDYHQEFYLYTNYGERLRQWINGNYASQAHENLSPPPYLTSYAFLNMTPSHLNGRLFVAKAACEHTLPLTFGKVYPFAPKNLAEDLMIHPIA